MSTRIVTKRSSQIVNSVGSMLLFLLFTICALVMVTIASGTYSRISKRFNDTFNSAASVRYISNKIRSCDSVGLIDTENSMLVLNEDGYKTIIYLKDGGIYEASVSESSEITAVGGDLLFDVTAINFTDCGNGLIKISAYEDEDDNYETYCRY